MTRSTKKKQKVSETETLIREDLAEESDYSEEDLIVMDDIIVDDHLKKNKKNYERVTTKKNKVIDDLSVEEDEKLEIEEEPVVRSVVKRSNLKNKMVQLQLSTVIKKPHNHKVKVHSQ